VSSRGQQVLAATIVAVPLLLMPPVAGEVSAAGVTHSHVRKAKAKRPRHHHHRKHKRKKPPHVYPITKAACVMLRPEDRDLIIRTVMGEANGEPMTGKVAVAAVIKNRLLSGEYGGSTVPGVLLKDKQFEPWGTRRRELLSYQEDDPRYQEAGEAVDRAFSGEDPTNGATHFANVGTVADRGNTSALGWLRGMSNRSQIGRHTFGNADGKGDGSTRRVDTDDDEGGSVLGRMSGYGGDDDLNELDKLATQPFDLDEAMNSLSDETDDPRRLAVRSLITEILDGLQPSAGQGHAVAQPDDGAAREDEEA
jgi:spore germination cell wall hydrolase CwlJ-like protein